MLVLTRKPEESIMIVSPSGDVIEIYLAKVDNDRAKIGIEAPTNFKIFRKEIYEAILRENPDPESFEKEILVKKFFNKNNNIEKQ